MLNKVMFFLPTLGGGGAERTVIQLANSFAEQGLNIDLVVCNLTGEKSKLLPEVSPKINLVDLACGRVISAIQPLKLLLQKENYQVLVATQTHSNIVCGIAKKLAKAGIIELSRGVGGGCRLICDLHDISLLTLIAIMDADRPISACMQTNYHCPWREKYRQVCLVHTHLSHLQKEINEKLHSYSLYTILFDTHI